MEERLDDNCPLTFGCSLWIILDMWAILLPTRTTRTAHPIASAIASLITPRGAGVGMKIDGETLSMNVVAAIMRLRVPRAFGSARCVKNFAVGSAWRLRWDFLRSRVLIE